MDMQSFLISVDPTYGEYAGAFTEGGFRTVQELQTIEPEDFPLIPKGAVRLIRQQAQKGASVLE